jgi:DNA (cytosine-5)-methyltransferase 1
MYPAIYDTGRDSDLAAVQRWPWAARFDGNRRHAVHINAYPDWVPRAPLAEFLQFEGKPLSSRATRGFLSRTERAKLRFPDGFQDRLREHLFDMEAKAFGADTRFAVAAE